eukprot:TRINITY_DN35134_c0_g1_i1.p1 TRINITY_DN35134_c0_g1~~TRINITY_DN35134_c0_g1_i1.p1  ORF type:complete len:104 (-),score=12.28 TRINITY_DN35134_c0_g1_i1:128-439(-)
MSPTNRNCNDGSECDMLSKIAQAALVHSPNHQGHNSHQHGNYKSLYISVCLFVYIVIVVLVVRRQFARLMDRDEPLIMVTNKAGKTKMKGYDALNMDDTEVLI